MAQTEHATVPQSLDSPGISIEFHGDPDTKSAQASSRSAPHDVQSFPSPMRHHRRTPSAHREIKVTLDARSEYLSDDGEGRLHHRINQYVIKDEIGRGSYGAVHLATDQFGNEYAVKEFSKARLRKRAQSNILRRGPRMFGRFPTRAGFGAPDAVNTDLSDHRAKEAKDALYLIREEVAIMKKLNHPNLVQLIEVLDDPEEDTLYMVLEMCKKGVVMKVGLGQSATPYPEETCRHWFRDLILGIEYLHSQGVVHRDIKPDNLLLTEDDVLKIVDFGVSEMFEKSGNMRTSKSAGSPAFLPPELCVAKHGDVSGTAADIWSMGVSLYCLRYGRIPFERENVLDIYEAIRTETPKLPPDENPDFVDLMGRLLEKDPEKRIRMAELREHPWVTKGGTDPLLSAEENCADPVDPPNPLELNRAFTRRMSHLLYVIKAISKFKSLLGPKDPTGRSRSARRKAQGNDDTAAPSASPSQDGPDTEQSTAEFAARVLREREEFLRNGGRASVDEMLRAAQGEQPPRLLGIGTGGIDDFCAAAPAADVVSDSPSVVDFNIYDRAFEAELERIRRSSSRKGGHAPGRNDGAGRKEAGADGAAAPVHLTRLNEKSHYTVADENLTTAWAGQGAGEMATPRSLSGVGRGEPHQGLTLADVVARAVEEARGAEGGR